MPYKISDFKLEHLFDIEPREELMEETEFLRKDKLAQSYYVNKAKTVLYKNKPVLIISIINLGFGTYMPLLIVSKDAIKHKTAIIKYIYEYFELNVGSDVRRIEALIDVRDKIALKFVKFFGFDIIGIKHCSSLTGEDQIIVERMYRKV